MKAVFGVTGWKNAGKTTLVSRLVATFNARGYTVSLSGGADSGWRRTSYAYLLLKAKGPEVDRIPPLKLDLDFNDVTG
ncbi:MAG: molybdopterin-guanine dinucleotide biosynthesis protein MobB, partial [Pseudomonadota bacterium]